jgi:hypothetical protein
MRDCGNTENEPSLHLETSFCSVQSVKMDSSQKIPHTMLIVIAILFVVPSCYTIARSATNSTENGLHNHGEIHQAKNLIDALSFKLYSNLQKYQSKYENLKTQSNEYLAQSGTTREEIKMLNKLKGLLNDLTKKSSSVCEKFYTNFDFIAARKIVINSSSSLQKDYTVALQGIVMTILHTHNSCYEA